MKLLIYNIVIMLADRIGRCHLYILGDAMMTMGINLEYDGYERIGFLLQDVGAWIRRLSGLVLQDSVLIHIE